MSPPCRRSVRAGFIDAPYESGAPHEAATRCRGLLAQHTHRAIGSPHARLPSRLGARPRRDFGVPARRCCDARRHRKTRRLHEIDGDQRRDVGDRIVRARRRTAAGELAVEDRQEIGDARPCWPRPIRRSAAPRAVFMAGCRWRNTWVTGKNRLCSTRRFHISTMRLLERAGAEHRGLRDARLRNSGRSRSIR